MKYINFFKEYFSGYKWNYLIGIFLLMLINVLFLGVPYLIGEAINSLYDNSEELTTYIFVFIILGLLATALKFISRHMLLGSIRHFEFLLRRKLFNHALYIPTSYYEEHGPGKVMALMTNDVTSLRVSLGLGVMIFVDAIFFGIVSFFMMAQHLTLVNALITLSPMPIIVFGMIRVSNRMRTKQREAQNTYSDLTEFIQELFLGMPVIRAFNKEGVSFGRFASINEVNYDNNMKVALLDAILTPITFMAPFFCYAISIYLCSYLILKGEMTVGDMVAVNGYLMLVIGPIMGLGSLSSVLQKGFASLDRISSFLSIKEEIHVGSKERLSLGTIALNHLTFTYKGNKEAVLKDVNMEIQPNSFIGIVGGPGSGKSTLLKLLLRLQETPEGMIFIDGQDITKMALEVLRRSIAYVPPQALVLGTTIRENISFGETPVHPLSVEEAARRAALTRDLEERIEMEKETSNGRRKGSKGPTLREAGANLSGGQKQRINIARGLYKNAPYLLLDDSFSALDMESARQIISTLRSEKKQTIIFISHRLEALVDADMIYVFKDGSIVESGTHEKLIGQRGEYHRLYEVQIVGKEQYETQ